MCMYVSYVKVCMCVCVFYKSDFALAESMYNMCVFAYVHVCVCLVVMYVNVCVCVSYVNMCVYET